MVTEGNVFHPVMGRTGGSGGFDVDWVNLLGVGRVRCNEEFRSDCMMPDAFFA